MARGKNLTLEQVERIRELRYVDGLTCAVVAERMGLPADTVNGRAPGRPGKVPVAPVREAFERSGLTAAEVARRMRWQTGAKLDTSHIRRTLGLADDVSGNGIRSRRVLADAETVSLLAEAIGVAPWEVLP